MILKEKLFPLIISAVESLKAKMPDYTLTLKCEDFVLFLVVCDCKLKIFEF